MALEILDGRSLGRDIPFLEMGTVTAVNGELVSNCFISRSFDQEEAMLEGTLSIYAANSR